MCNFQATMSEKHIVKRTTQFKLNDFCGVDHKSGQCKNSSNTTQFNLAKKWLAKKWEPLLDWVHDALFLTTDLDLTNALLLLILSDPCVYLSANHLFAKNKFG